MKRTLRLYQPVLFQASPKIFIEELSDAAMGWRRTTRADGGYWLGSFTITGPRTDLMRWFYEYLGHHFEERMGGRITWEGLVYEMDLVLGGMVLRKSLDMMYNYVTGTYIDENDEVHSAGVYQNEQSINQYGRREEQLRFDGQDSTAMGRYCDTYMTENSWPWARAVGTDFTTDERLDVTVAGYVFTANWRYETAGDDSYDDLSTWVSDIIGTDCEFLNAAGIDSNTTQVYKETNTPQRAHDVIMDLVSLGDSNADSYHFYVDTDRQAYYRKIETSDYDPDYYMRGNMLYDTAGSNVSIDPFTVKPGIVRNMNYPVKKREYDGWLLDARDFYVVEIEASDGGGLSLKTDYFEESDVLSAMMSYQNMLDRMKEKEGGSGSKKDKTNWKRRFNVPEEEWESIMSGSRSEIDAEREYWKGKWQEKG